MKYKILDVDNNKYWSHKENNKIELTDDENSASEFLFIEFCNIFYNEKMDGRYLKLIPIK